MRTFNVNDTPMNSKTLCLILLLLFTFNLEFTFSQITLSTSTIPQVNDVLMYNDFEYAGASEDYSIQGEDMTWSLSQFIFTGMSEEAYLDIQNFDLKDTFPDANMLLTFGPFEAAAIGSENAIEIIGTGPVEAQGFLGDESSNRLEDPFVLRQVPFTYEDKIESDFAIQFAFDAALIPGLDSIELPIPGATLDSLRFTNVIYRQEEAIGWGKLDLMGNNFDVLQLQIVDSTATIIEAGLGVLGQVIWFDASAFLGEDGGGFGENSAMTTYKFVTEDDKESLLEFTENSITDTLGQEIGIQITGRMSANISSNTVEQNSVSVSLMPVPAYDKLHLIGENIELFSQYQIIGNNGEVITAAPLNYSQKNAIPIMHLHSGLYYLKLISADRITTLKFTKQ